MKHKFVVWRGTEKSEIEADSVGLIMPSGSELELSYKIRDKVASISANNGGLVVLPVASNCADLAVKRHFNNQIE